MMTPDRVAEKKATSIVSDFNNKSETKIKTIAKNLCVVLELIHYKNFDTNVLIKNMEEQLSKCEDFTSSENRDLLQLAAGDLLTVAKAQSEFLNNIVAQFETSLEGDN